MPECIAITREGFGSVWSFTTPIEAWKNPLVQFGDVVVEDQYILLDVYFPNEIPKLVELLGNEELADRIQTAIRNLGEQPPRLVMKHIEENFLHDIWNFLLTKASPVPEDPTTLYRLAREDREAVMIRRPIMTTSQTTTGSAKTPKAAVAPKAAAAPKAPKAPKPPKQEPTEIGGFDKKSTIKLGQNEKGVFSPTNNPKRGASALRFAKYKDGATIEETVKIDGGPTGADIRFDADPKRGLIIITPPAKA